MATGTDELLLSKNIAIIINMESFIMYNMFLRYTALTEILDCYSRPAHMIVASARASKSRLLF